MKVDWKALSFSLIISVIVNGLIGLYVLYDYFNRLSISINLLMNDYLRRVESNISNDNSASLTIAGATYYPLEVYVLAFIVSFIFITILCYFMIRKYLNKTEVQN